MKVRTLITFEFTLSITHFEDLQNQTLSTQKLIVR